MTALKERAVGIIEQIPDEQISYVISMLENFADTLKATNETKLSKSQAAYQNLQKYRKKAAEDTDYKKEIADAIEEKYESIS